MGFTCLHIDPLALDAELTDAACVGPELAQSALAYCATPRALVWRNASSDWPLLLITLPLVTRLTLMTNPIFGRLVRDWGLGIRFIGVDAEQRVYDFRHLLNAQSLSRLVEALAHLVTQEPKTAPGAGPRPNDARAFQDAADTALDTLFAMLAAEMMTILERRRGNWPQHLAREGLLVTDRPTETRTPGLQSLFDRRSRFPEFLAQVRTALRASLIDIGFYGRILRSIDSREEAAESRILSIIDASLDPIVQAKLRRSRIGPHLGCYNWLLVEPRASAHRASILVKLPAFGSFFAERLLAIGQVGDDSLARRIAAVPGSTQSELALLRAVGRAIDSGQDRWTIETLSRYFRVSENLMRSLWRHCPPALGAPPEWHLRQILLALNELPERSWPSNDAGWSALKATAVPPSVASA